MRKFCCCSRSNSFVVGYKHCFIYILDANGSELAKFSADRNCYMVTISPNERFAAVKSTSGKLYFFDLTKLLMTTEVNLPYKLAQDHGFCFSRDSRCLYNLEDPLEFSSELVSYDFQSAERSVLVPAQANRLLGQIRYSEQLNTYCILGKCFHAISIDIPAGDFIAMFDGNIIYHYESVSEYEAYNRFLELIISPK